MLKLDHNDLTRTRGTITVGKKYKLNRSTKPNLTETRLNRLLTFNWLIREYFIFKIFCQPLEDRRNLSAIGKKGLGFNRQSITMVSPGQEKPSTTWLEEEDKQTNTTI